jgi:GNAT superfamily N-acetyltransferase
MIIRPVAINELFDVSKFVPAFYVEFGDHPMGSAYEYDQVTFIKTWTEWLNNSNYVLFGAFDGDRCVGGLGGMISKHPYTLDTMMGYEHFWFVYKEYRKSGVGKRLINAFQAWLKEKGVKYMIMVYIHGGPSEKMNEFYIKEGFLPFESQMIKEL